jgi:hypothetical protein
MRLRSQVSPVILVFAAPLHQANQRDGTSTPAELALAGTTEGQAEACPSILCPKGLLTAARSADHR